MRTPRRGAAEPRRMTPCTPAAINGARAIIRDPGTTHRRVNDLRQVGHPANCREFAPSTLA